MRKFLLTGILSCYYLMLSAQTLTIFEYGSATDISGTTHFATLTSAVTDEHIVDFLVNNDSGSDQYWVITRRILNQPAGWSNFYCWGQYGQIGNCYDANPNEYHNSNKVFLPADNAGLLSSYVTSPGAGCASYRYYISVDSVSYIDSVDLQVCNTLGLNDLKSTEAMVAPNPANTSFVVSGPDGTAGVLEILDAAGNAVRKERILLPGTIDASTLVNGTYHLRIVLDDTRVIRQQLVVYH